MSKTIVSVTSLTSVGGTFVDWSIQFLSGQTKHYHTDTNCWIDLVNNPVNNDNDNAHNYKKNHPMGWIETASTLQKIIHQPDGLFTFYPSVAKYFDVRKQLNTNNNDQIMQYIKNDYHKMFELCSQKTKLIFINSSPEISLYHIKRRGLRAFLFQENKFGAADEIQTELDSYFFKGSQEKWNGNNKWDVREHRALNIRPCIVDLCVANPDFSLPHLWVDSRSLWTLGELTLTQIMNYIGLPIDPTRFKQWLPVYYQWARQQLEILDFCHVVPHIIDSIVNNWDYNLAELSFEQEVVIQHLLIYKHNLNLKTWQLDKFPTNTQDLHKLLEPNKHKVEVIY